MREDRSRWRLSGSRVTRDSGYECVFDRVFERVRLLESRLSAERQAAPDLLCQLLSHPQPRRMLVVRNSVRFCTAGLCEESLKVSWEARFDQPTRTRNLAELAVAMASRLSAETYGACVVADLRGRSWSHLGNALRLLADLQGAVEALQSAESELEQGSGDALELGFFLRARATLVRDLGDVEQAEALVDESIALYQEAGLDHEVGMSLLSKGYLRAHAEDYEGEVRCLQDALQRIDLAREPRTRLIVVHNLATALHMQGRNAQALAFLVRFRFLYFDFGDRVALLQLHWLEGVIARGMDRHEMAEGALREARRGFLEVSMPFEVALVSLDLAHLYLEAGRTREVGELAVEMVSFFRSRQVHRHALAALLLFREAVQHEQATVSLVRRLSDFLERAQKDPTARFEPGSEATPPATPRR